MTDWYYAPWQYELRDALGLGSARMTLRTTRAMKIPDVATATVFAGALFLAYTPLFQPGPPAKTLDTLPIYRMGSIGGGMVV